ncbi:serine O-acetyltransferase [Rhodocista pekingensis]|uniref:Serine acetyltransferase n=2 Tax=Rhodocista pekingensis TaxID=201185 RepID=A0ABW2KWV9_9PROT
MTACTAMARTGNMDPARLERPGAAATVWGALRREAACLVAGEPSMARPLDRSVLRHADMAEALAALLSGKLAGEMEVATLADLIGRALADDPDIVEAAAEDLVAVRDRDPAAAGLAHPFLHFKGYQALQAHRVARHYWHADRRLVAFHIQSVVSERFGVDIHPNARIGRRVLIDHGTGVVIGETAVVGDDVSILQGVTLGGTGKEAGDRHPKVRNGVLIGAGAKILGNIQVGMCARVGAGSVVLHPVPAFATVAGVPARIVGRKSDEVPARTMDHSLPESVFVEHGAGI